MKLNCSLTRVQWLTLALVALAVAAMHFGWIDPVSSSLAVGAFGLSTSAFPVNPELTAIAIGYKNPEINLIADQVLPRVPTAKKFNWTKYSAAQGFTVPDTKVGRKSDPTMVDFSGQLVPDEVVDYGLDDLVPNDEIQAYDSMAKPASGGPVDPQALSTMMLTGLLELDREVRVAGLVFNTANYAAGNQATLSGTSQWSDYANSNPLSAIMSALDSTLIRPNKMVIGQQAWTVLRQHPKIVQAIFKTVQGAGVVTKEMLAETLEMDQIIVGNAWVNTARKGQTPTYARTWGKHCSLLFSSMLAAQTMQPNYGFTAQWGTRIAGAMPEPRKGLRGGVLVRSGESVKEIISANDAGYLFQNCVA